MTYASIQFFKEKLNQLINCYDIPLINNSAIISERPQFQLLYDELGSMIQTLFIDQHQDLNDLQKLNDLRRRFALATEEAQYIVDLFLSRVHSRNNKRFPSSEYFKRSQHPNDVRRSLKSVVDLFLSCVHNRNNGHFPTSENLNPSLNLDDVRRSLKSLEVEFTSMIINSTKTGPSPRGRCILNQSAPAEYSISNNLLRSKKSIDQIFVGLDRDVGLIRDKLVEDPKKVDVVSIVGMGGIGKTTLTTKVFDDGYVKHHFHVRGWVTVSQTYDKRAVLTQILASIGVKPDFEKADDSKLHEMVHKRLMGKRYLIVIDDIWHTKTWDNLKLFFPHDYTGSRILLTSRLTEVAKHANPDGLIHRLGCLNKERSWELLCLKVFHGNECPEWSIKPGMQIIENCRGLPLAVVVIAGVLAKQAWSEKFWVEFAKKTSSYIVGDENGCLETLALSYNHLPLHLRECFLYLGGFPEDHKFKVRRLIWLWVAEGFIQQDGNRRLEDIAEGYLMDLIDRNLVNVAYRRKSGGAVKACILHDLVRELCLEKAKEERFIIKIERLIKFCNLSNVTTRRYKPARLFINNKIENLDRPCPSTQNFRSVLCFSDSGIWSYNMEKYLSSFVLLRVLGLGDCLLTSIPYGLEFPVHLRYLAIWIESDYFPSSICNLWSLQTLICIRRHKSIVLPGNISDLVNLRHLWSYHPYTNESKKMPLFLFSIEKPMILQTISNVNIRDGIHNFQKFFPCIKELRCTTYIDEENDFKSLTFLENLKLTGWDRRIKGELWKDRITFPMTLKSLTLGWCRLPWSAMSIIHSLPNLQVLKLHSHAFEGNCWNTDEQEFGQLKFLRLELLDIKLWEAYSPSFPCLKRLEIFSCYHLQEIPLEISEIPMLELIKVSYCRHSVGESVSRIQQEQHDYGNFDLKIDISYEISK